MDRTQFVLLTDAIDSKGQFDPRYTCDSDNSSPELRWMNPPEEARSFAVLVEDPGASGGTLTQWMIYNIPATISHLPAGIPAQETLPNGIRQGVNSFKKLGYGGPCPDSGDAPHSYVIRIFALASAPEVPPRATREQLMAAMQPLILATAQVRGRYQRNLPPPPLRRAG
jgi:hypothetical protein